MNSADATESIKPEDTKVETTNRKMPKRPVEVEVDASTLTILAVAALLIPLLIAGFIR